MRIRHQLAVSPWDPSVALQRKRRKNTSARGIHSITECSGMCVCMQRYSDGWKVEALMESGGAYQGREWALGKGCERSGVSVAQAHR